MTAATIRLLAAAAIGAFLAWGEYTRRTRVTGQLVPRLGMASVAAFLAIRSAALNRLARSQSSRVVPGRPLATLSRQAMKIDSHRRST